MDDADRGPEVTDEEILTVFANRDERWVETKEAASELPISADALADRVDDLYERGLLVRDDDDVVDEVWRLAPDVKDEMTVSEERVETDVEAQATKTTGSETPLHDEETPETPPPDPQAEPLSPVHEPVADAIEAFDPPGTPEQKDLRRGALRRAYTYLRKRGSARREDFESDVFPQASGAYESPDEGWWEHVVRPGLDRLPDVEIADEDEEWRFTGEDRSDGAAE